MEQPMTQDPYPSADAPGVRSIADSHEIIGAFRRQVAEHVTAIQAAGRDMLSQQVGTDNNASAKEIRLEITVGPDPKEGRSTVDSVECWDHDYICGKTSTGYIHCTVRACMEIGPVTLSQ
jgi:hypothetical protein